MISSFQLRRWPASTSSSALGERFTEKPAGTRLPARRHAGDKTDDRYGAVDLIDASNCDIENILGIEEDNRKIRNLEYRIRVYSMWWNS